MADLLLRLLVGVLPVLGFLGALIYLDSFKLVRLRFVLSLIGIGGVVAGLCYVLNAALLEASGIGLREFTRYLAPATEEIGKGLVIVVLVRLRRVAFLVDAAIFGFAVGSGFAVVENLYYLGFLPSGNFGIWIVRGFGTAIMHGGATAMFAMTVKALSGNWRWRAGRSFVPGLLLAYGLHSAYNHFFLTPILSTVGLLLLLPPLLTWVFRRSEESVREWLDVGFDADAELLGLIHSGAFSDSRVGQYLASLKERFRGEVVADLLCYLRLHVELSLRAKGLLLMREAGFKVKPDEATQATFRELEFLEGSIGRTGRLAISPFLHISGKDLWQLYMLKG